MTDCLDNSHDHDELRAPYIGAPTPQNQLQRVTNERAENYPARLTSKTHYTVVAINLGYNACRRPTDAR
jgi:hypothetical protein